jgi:hypothetical protein
MLRPNRILVLLFVCAFTAFAAGAQNQTSVQTSSVAAQGLALAQRALTAMTNGIGVIDVTLTGTAQRIAGSDDETGTITLRARGTAESRMDHVVSGGTRSEVRNSANGAPQGEWIGLDGTAHPMAYHNCQTDAAWFFPALSVQSQLANPNLSVSYVGQETKNQIAVYHLQFILHHTGVSADIASRLDPLTATDVYLEASSFLPVAIVTNTHPDNNLLMNIPVEVDFSDYRVVQGVPVPFRIQKFLNGSLSLDVTVQAATVNSGLSDAEFSVQSS